MSLQAKREEERLNKMLTKMGNKPIHLSESDSSPSKTTSAPATERKLRTDGSRPAVTQDKVTTRREDVTLVYTERCVASIKNGWNSCIIAETWYRDGRCIALIHPFLPSRRKRWRVKRRRG